MRGRDEAASWTWCDCAFRSQRIKETMLAARWGGYRMWRQVLGPKIEPLDLSALGTDTIG